MKGNSEARTPAESIAAIVGPDRGADIRQRLPRASIGESCVRFQRVSDLDEDVLRQLIRESDNASWGV